MDPLALLLLGLLGAIASGIALFSGFGLSTALVPAFALLFPLPLAIAAVAVVHLTSSAVRLVVMRDAIEARTALRFAVPAVIGALLGALLLDALGELPALFSYRLAGIVRQPTLVDLAVGTSIVALTAYEISRTPTARRVDGVGLALGGLFSGFFGGLAGNQGAIRGAVLTRAGLEPLALIATGAVAAVCVDIGRISVYALTDGFSVLGTDAGVGAAVAAASAGSLAGALVGRRLLGNLRSETLRHAIAAALMLGGAGIAAGII